MVVESTNDTVILVDDFDGSVVDPLFIDLTLATPAPSTPIEAVSVNGEVWVSDQIADTVFRFSEDGTFIGTTTTGRDNMRGIAFANGSLYVSNSGTGGAGFGDVCKEYLVDGTLNNVFAVGDPFDVLDYNGTLLIANIAADSIEQFEYDGTFITTLHDSDGTTGIDFPEQLGQKSNGNILAGGFSAPAGIFEYDPTGVQVNYIDTGTSVRGVHELGNGNILWTSGSGVHIYDVNSGTSSAVVTGVSGRFISPLEGLGATSYCTSVPNSTGNAAVISAEGSNVVADQDLTFTTEGCIPNGVGLYYFGTTQVQVPFGDGFRCTGGTVQRVRPIVFADVSGVATRSVNFGAPYAQTIVPGASLNFQYWYRDSGPSGFNLSDAINIEFE